MSYLHETDLKSDPIDQFRDWFAEAIAAGVPQAEAMTLATATPDGRPSARMVLLKGVDDAGFAFFTNYESRKATELAANPRAALVFYWLAVDRQVRVEGRIERVSAEESDAYFATRAWGSRIGAWASPQSSVIAGREVLENQAREIAEKYSDEQVPRPLHWGGYRLIPEVIEFWESQPNRLHDRIQYQRRADGSWQRQRLAP